MFRIFSLLLFVLVTSSSLSAQFRQDLDEKTTIGFGLGGSSCFTDIGAGDPYREAFNLNLSAQFRIAYKHSSIFTTDVTLLFGKVKADDLESSLEYRQERRLNFESKYNELGVYEEIYFLAPFLKNTRFPVLPYFIVGGAIYNYNPTAVASDNQTYALRDLGTEGQGQPGYADKYSLLGLAYGLGGGIKFSLNDKLNLKLESVLKFLDTDYLDDVSGNYAPKDVVEKNGGQVAVELSDRRLNPTYTGQRGSRFYNDIVYNLMLTASYNIGDIFTKDKIQCYEF